MPTGYTHYIINEGYDFRRFALICARAMGANVLMREEPMDAPIREYEVSPYYAESVEKAEAELERLRAMPADEQLAYGREQIAENITHFEGYVERDREQNQRLLAVRAEVVEWVPPTPEHDGFKVFMLEQIDVSLDDAGYYEDEIEKWRAAEPQEVYRSALKRAIEDVEYAQKSLREETERVRKRNAWNAALIDSLNTLETV